MAFLALPSTLWSRLPGIFPALRCRSPRTRHCNQSEMPNLKFHFSDNFPKILFVVDRQMFTLFHSRLRLQGLLFRWLVSNDFLNFAIHRRPCWEPFEQSIVGARRRKTSLGCVCSLVLHFFRASRSKKIHVHESGVVQPTLVSNCYQRFLHHFVFKLYRIQKEVIIKLF